LPLFVDKFSHLLGMLSKIPLYSLELAIAFPSKFLSSIASPTRYSPAKNSP
jgi:hypothetical protein